MANPKEKALQNKISPKEKYKATQSRVRKYYSDRGYTTHKEKTYFDYSHRDRKNIRDNAKPGSNARKYLGPKSNPRQPFYE